MISSEDFVDKCIKECSKSHGAKSGVGTTNSRFHKIFVSILALNFGFPALFMYGFGFFELMPALKC
jgi:hypothetical protein